MIQSLADEANKQEELLQAKLARRMREREKKQKERQIQRDAEREAERANLRQEISSTVQRIEANLQSALTPGPPGPPEMTTVPPLTVPQTLPAAPAALPPVVARAGASPATEADWNNLERKLKKAVKNELQVCI